VRRQPSAPQAVEAVRAQYPQFSQAALEHVVEHNTRSLPDGGVEWKYDPGFVAEGLRHALDDLRPYAARISCPVLILRAGQSWEMTPQRMPEVERVFSASPSVQTVTVAGAVGNLELENPDAVATAIRGWLAATPDRVAASAGAQP
jgi:pimeloyl-ACP methyl ester carboxylesterase